MAKASVAKKPMCKSLTTETWDDFEKLFGKRGACAGCWCMFFRCSRKEFDANQGAGNRKAMLRLVKGGASPGILLYKDAEAVGWCAVAPREEYVALERSRVMGAVDEKPVWSVTCFFIAKQHRKQGLSVALLEAAVAFAKKKGAKIVEGYPQDLSKPQADAFVYHGLASTFEKAGFREVERRSPTRPIMRREKL
jgi:GNAT superfamily N-acetyltransferase